MQREYRRQFSHALGHDMEMLTFGSGGRTLLVFPTSMGRFYQWEDFGMVSALADLIDSGRIRLVCVDSVDGESWYAKNRPPAQRVERHLDYERYILDEVMPQIPDAPITCGSSFGALHAVLLAARHPNRTSGFIALSGAYDTARWLNGYSDDNTYFTNLLAFIPNLKDETFLGPLRQMQPKVIATGAEDPNVTDSIKLGEAMRAIGLDVLLDIWPGWEHDWPYWKEMMRKYLGG